MAGERAGPGATFPSKPLPHMDQAETPLKLLKSQTDSQRAPQNWKKPQRLPGSALYFTDGETGAQKS